MKIAIIAKARNGAMVAYRQRLTLSQSEAAKLAEICVMSWNRLECMRFDDTTNGVIEKVADTIGVHPYVIAPPELRGSVIKWEETAFVDMDHKQLVAATNKMLLPVEVRINSTELHEHMAKQMEKLDDRQRKVLTLRYGLNGTSAHTLKEIAKIVNLTRERVRQLILKAERILGESNTLKQLIHDED